MCQATTLDVAALVAEVRSRQPERCPACQSASVQPLDFEPDGRDWDCERCGAIFDGGEYDR